LEAKALRKRNELRAKETGGLGEDQRKILQRRGMRWTRKNGNEVFKSFTHKICNICHMEKQVEEFWITKPRNNRNISFRYAAACKPCDKARQIKYRLENKIRLRTIAKQWAFRNKEKVKGYQRTSHLRSYGLTTEKLELMRKKQKEKCLICENKRRLVIDHCHKTLRVRGLLCLRCNMLVGMIEAHRPVYKNMKRYLNLK
jgi:hypothetical protein